MKKLLSLILSLGMLLFVSCEAEPPENDGIAALPRETKTLEETKEVWKDWVDDGYQYDLSEYVTLPPYEGVVASFDDSGVCTPEELEEAILQIRLSLATFEEKTGEVALYDRVTVSFEVVLEGEVIPEMSISELEIVVGLEGYEGTVFALSRSLVGAEVGELCWADYEYPKSPLSGEYAGKTVVAKGTVLSVESAVLPQVDEDFVHELEGFENATVEDFYDAVSADVITEKKAQKVSAVWVAFCEGVTVHKYPEKELEEYREEYSSYYESFAEMMGMELEDFLMEYVEMTPEKYEREKEIYAEEMVKNDMIFTQLIRLTGVTVTQEEYEVGALKYFEAESENFKSFEEFEAYHSREQILENLVRDKALFVVVDKAVCEVRE